jgi:hypothetical protein
MITVMKGEVEKMLRLKFVLLYLVASVLSACAFGNTYLSDSKLEPVDRETLISNQVTVAVLPFTSHQSNNISAFESQYFAIKVASQLKTFNIIRNAYYSYTETPATNYYIKGDVTLSDGENTEVSLKLYSADNTEILSYTFGYANSMDDFQANSQLDKLWYRAVNQVVDTIVAAKTPDRKLLQAQVIGYGGQPTTIDYPEKIRRVIYDASIFETDKLLLPLTVGLEKKLSVMEPRYATWQQTCTENAIKSRSAKNRETFDIFFAMLGAAASGAAKASGDYANANQLETQSYKLMEMASEAGNEADKFQSMITEVGQLVDQNIETEQVAINNTKVVLSGTFEEKIKTVRNLVKKILAQEGLVEVSKN